MDSYNCSICLELLSSPVTISCQHTYCRKCISTIKGDKCPLCREPIHDKDIENVNSLLEQFLKEKYPNEYKEGIIKRKKKRILKVPTKNNEVWEYGIICYLCIVVCTIYFGFIPVFSMLLHGILLALFSFIFLSIIACVCCN